MERRSFLATMFTTPAVIPEFRPTRLQRTESLYDKCQNEKFTCRDTVTDPAQGPTKIEQALAEGWCAPCFCVLQVRRLHSGLKSTGVGRFGA